MSVRLLSSSPQSKNPRQSIANESGSQHWAQVSQGLVEYIQKSVHSSFSSNTPRLIVFDVTKNSNKFQEMEEIIFNREIDVEEWKSSLNYSEENINKILGEFLRDFDISPNVNNIDWIKTIINGIIENYEKEYSIRLDQSTRKMLKNLITKMSYDKLCIKKPSSK